MKKLFIALFCTVIGFSAYAKDSNPKGTAPVVIKTELKTTSSENNTKPVESKTEKTSARRHQYAFNFRDQCGQVMTVWVSAGNDVTQSDMFGTAHEYASGTLTANGCFPK
jgi:hypothetical protein